MSSHYYIPKFVFIIPYRNREPQLNHFKYYMKYILEDVPEDEYEIYYVKQCDNRPFNRGAIKNIGFIAIKEKYPFNYKDITFVFNDIDTLPAYKNILNYITSKGIIKHFFGYTFALGGIVSITGYDFEKIGGYPNYWGWGMEDNDLQHRAIKSSIIIDRTNFYNIDDSNIINIKDNKKKLCSNQQIWRAGPKNTEGYNDIEKLRYNLEKDFINVIYFKTKINETNDTYCEKDSFLKCNAETKYKPIDSINTEYELKKYGVNVIFSKNMNSKNFAMKYI